jgi:phosphatidylglycerophosphate synthase
VSRHFNRRLSRPLARAIAPSPVTPNVVTVFTGLLAFATAGAVALGWNIAGGIAIQAVNIIDGVDGDLARLRNAATRFGGFLDTVIDRYADAAIIGGMTIYAARFEDLPRPEVVGMLALAAALSVSYSRARIEASMPGAPANLDAIFGLASRDVRLLVAAAGTVAGQCYWTLVLLAVISSATVAWRLVYLRFAKATAGLGG